MLGVIVNAVAVFVGGTIGVIFKKGIGENLTSAIMKVMGLVTVLIGVQSAIKTADTLCVIICLVVGTVIGELIRIDDGINGLGDWVQKKFSGLSKQNSNQSLNQNSNQNSGSNSSFSEGFVTTCILFCVGSMTIVGSLQAGINHDYSILFAKSVMDFVSAIVFAAALGYGVIATSVFVLVFQGAIALLASSLSSVLTDVAVIEMTAVGGVILIGMAINILELYKEKPIKVANMIPAILLPPLYLTLVGLF